VATQVDRPSDAPFYQARAAPLLLAAIALAGLAYLVLARPTAGVRSAAGASAPGE